MNLYKSILATAAVALGAASLTGCQDRFDDWDLSAPVATLEANTTILDFKKTFWQENDNYCVEIPAREDGSHYIVKGRVISSDREGNVFKCLYIQDETAALPISINQYSLYVNNRIGQEIVIDLTGLHCGRYSGLFQIGALQYDEKTGDPGTTFLDPEIFMLHRQYNGNPDPAEVDTIPVEDISAMTSDLMKWQGQLVIFKNATFTNGNNADNNQLCDVYHSSGFNQELTGSFGTLNVRTSGYSTFWNEKIPAPACDVVGIAGYYAGSSPWQLILNDYQGIMNVGDPSVEGIKTKPYTIERAIELSATNNVTGWVKGYIVGTIQPEITTISSNADIQWIGSEPFIVDNYLILAPTLETRDYTKCLLVPITANSALYTYGNLADHPDNAGRTLNIRGRFSTAMGMASLAANDGSAPTFELQGVDVPGSGDQPEQGDGTEAKPYTVAQAIVKQGSTAWVSGYIVGCMTSNPYVLEVTAPFTVASNVYIADNASETDTDKMLPVQLVKETEIRSNVNLLDNPANLGAKLSIEGELTSYFSQPGLKNPTAYKLEGQGSTPTPGQTEGDGTEAKPYTVTDILGLNSPKTVAWVEGYIVGSADGTGGNYEPLNFTANGKNATTNILIAATAGETDITKIVPVQLPSGDIRTQLNLKENPANLGKKITLEGKLDTYFNRPGVRSVTNYKL